MGIKRRILAAGRQLRERGQARSPGSARLPAGVWEGTKKLGKPGRGAAASGKGPQPRSARVSVPLGWE